MGLPRAAGTSLFVIVNRCPSLESLTSPAAQPVWLPAFWSSSPTHCFDAK